MIAQNIADIRTRIDKASGGREVRILAATKNAQPAQINEAISAGIRLIGENRMQDAVSKFPRLLPAEKHFIGYLQTNKVRHAVRYFDVIQSVDRLRLAREINSRAERTMPVMIEVNVSGEEQKHGIAPEETETFYDKLLQLANLSVVGLMTVAPYVNPDEARQYFREMRRLQGALGLRELSMGMSNDYVAAVEEGSTMVRIGSAIFADDVDKRKQLAQR